MIVLAEKKLCSGCTACYAICPKSAIDMEEDSEGFKYPVIDSNKCVECGLCVKVCPSLQIKPATSISQLSNPESSFFPKRDPIRVYAAISNDVETRMQSSSGGVFTLLARRIIADGGIVYGAGWSKDMRLLHKSAENEGELADLRSSKYLQSDLGNVFEQVRTQLNTGRKVLFSGTPCQVAGLRSYLAKLSVNQLSKQQLLLVDLICHAVPSPKVFGLYKRELEERYGAYAARISFRRKDYGWKRFSMSVLFENDTEYLQPLDKDPFMKGFLNELFNRPSCHQCLCRNLRSGSDITLADYWGVQTKTPHMDDDKGTSLVLVNSEYGQKAIRASQLDMKLHESNFEDVKRTNSAVYKSPSMHVKRDWFFRKLFEGITFSSHIAVTLRPSLFNRFRSYVVVIRRKLLH